MFNSLYFVSDNIQQVTSAQADFLGSPIQIVENIKCCNDNHRMPCSPGSKEEDCKEECQKACHVERGGGCKNGVCHCYC